MTQPVLNVVREDPGHGAVAAIAAPSGRIRHRTSLKKVLLVQPPAYCNNYRTDMNPNVPLGIAYVAAVLEREGFEVRILDAFIEGWHDEVRVSDEKLLVGLSLARIKEIIADANPDVVGVTSMFTSQRKNAHGIARLAKEVNKEIVVIAGGAHPTAAPVSVLEDASVDVAVLGEGDNVIGALIRGIEEGRDLRHLDGIAFRDEAGRPVVMPKTTPVADLDALPFPARHLLPMEKYFAARSRHGSVGSKGKRQTSMITSRGCQFLCNFCTAFQVFTRTPRTRSVENVLAEIEQLVTRYGVDEIYFEDDQLLAKQRRSAELFDAMASRFTLHWDTPNGVSPWLLNEDILRKMKASGCYRVNLAIESGNQRVLDTIINKPVKLEKIPELVETIRRLGMEATTFLVVGNIGRHAVETLDQIRESFAFCRRLGVTPHTSILTAYPGSEVLEIAREKGYLIPGFDWDDLIIQKPQLQTPEWTPQQLKALVTFEALRTRWWGMLSSPWKTLRHEGSRLLRAPGVTLVDYARFVARSYQGMVRRRRHG